MDYHWAWVLLKIALRVAFGFLGVIFFVKLGLLEFKRKNTVGSTKEEPEEPT